VTIEHIYYKNQAYYTSKRHAKTRDVFRRNALNTDHNQ